jgi:hypothetical protein
MQSVATLAESFAVGHLLLKRLLIVTQTYNYYNSPLLQIEYFIISYSMEKNRSFFNCCSKGSSNDAALTSSGIRQVA